MIAHAQDGDEPITATDLLKIKQLGDVSLSPDGRQVVYSVRSIVPSTSESITTGGSTPDSASAAGVYDAYEYRTHLFLADPLRAAAHRQLTRGDLSATEPAWHPEGDRIAFMRPVDGTPQIFILPLLGGEAYPVTNVEWGAASPSWSPDGTRLLFSSRLKADEIRQLTNEAPEWPSERPGRQTDDAIAAEPDPDGSLEEIRAWLDENASKQRPRVFHRLNFLGETDLDDPRRYTHWFVIAPGASHAEPVLVTRGYYDFGGGEWTADGRSIIVSGAVTPEQHPDRVRETQLYVAAANGGGIRPFYAMEGYSLSSPVVAPNGTSVAFLARRSDDPGYAQTEIGVLPFSDPGAARLLTAEFDRSATMPKWSRDGWYLYFTAASNGGFPLYRVAAFDLAAMPEAAAPADSATGAIGDSLIANVSNLEAAADSAAEALAADADDVAAVTALAADSVAEDVWEPARGGTGVERLTSFDRGIRSFDVGSASVFFVATEVRNPYELYAADAPFTSHRRLTSHNADWIAEKRLSIPEPHTLMRDSLEIQYWVMQPSFYDEAQVYPLMLQIHGGPSAMWGPGEATMWHEFQFFASRGYGIVFSNPRGSGGYGYDFKRLNFQDWGTGPAGDVLAAASEAAQLPWVDAERQVVTGGSYAGYLTAWIVAHDDRFEAAVAQRGVYDLETFLGEGNAWRLVPTHFGGFPWDRVPDTTAAGTPLAAYREGDGAPALPNASEEGIASGAGVPGAEEPVIRTPVAQPDSSTFSTAAAADSLTQVAGPADSLIAVTGPPPDSAPSGSVPDSLAATVALSASEILIRNSPLTFVDQIRTPLLIIHADRDLRTGVTQSEVLYKSLKILERPVEYARYPDSGHDLSRTGDPLLRMDRILRIYEFMERFIR